MNIIGYQYLFNWIVIIVFIRHRITPLMVYTCSLQLLWYLSVPLSASMQCICTVHARCNAPISSALWRLSENVFLAFAKRLSHQLFVKYLSHLWNSKYPARKIEKNVKPQRFGFQGVFSKYLSSEIQNIQRLFLIVVKPQVLDCRRNSEMRQLFRKLV